MDKQSYRALIVSALKGGKILPPLPMVMSRLNEMLRIPDTTVRDLGRVIEMDAGLTAKIIRQVNSPFYGLISPVKTVTQAVIVLGFSEIRYLVIQKSIADLYKRSSRDAGIDLREIWECSLRIACLARAVAEQINYPVAESVFTAGILSKIGMLFFSNLLGEDYATVAGGNLLAENLPSAEEAAFSFNHIHLGFVLAQIWNFPVELVNCIAYQYNPVPSHLTFQTEAAYLYLARRLLFAEQHAETDETTWQSLPDMMVTNLDLSPAMFKDLRIAAEQNYRDFAQLL